MTTIFQSSMACSDIARVSHIKKLQMNFTVGSDVTIQIQVSNVHRTRADTHVSTYIMYIIQRIDIPYDPYFVKNSEGNLRCLGRIFFLVVPFELRRKRDSSNSIIIELHAW